MRIDLFKWHKNFSQILPFEQNNNMTLYNSYELRPLFAFISLNKDFEKCYRCKTALKKRGDSATNVELRMLKNSYHNYVKLVLSPTHLNPQFIYYINSE